MAVLHLPLKAEYFNAIRERSQGYQQAAKKAAEGKKADNPWFTDYEAMCLKTVIRRLFKYLPVSVEIQRAVQLDEKADAGLPQDNGLVIDGDFRKVPEDEGMDEGRDVAAMLDGVTDRAGFDQLLADSLNLPQDEYAELERLGNERFPKA